jgi:hypothetical protein
MRPRHVAAGIVALTTATIAFPTASARTSAWHDCVRAGERHGFFRAADGVRIAYAEAGHGTGGIVFAHGARGDLCDWMWALRDPRLQRFRMLAFDFRGNGLSDYPDYPRSIHYRADVIAAVTQLRRDGARKIATLGISRSSTRCVRRRRSPSRRSTSSSATTRSKRFAGPACRCS